MRTATALAGAWLVVALLIAPTVNAASAPPKPEFPAAVSALLPGWVAKAEALGANDTQKPWYAEAKTFLDGAKTAQTNGRMRTAMYDLETYTELVLAGQINDTTRGYSSDAERKTYALDRLAEWHNEALAAWQAYRARLHKLEADIHSVQGMEIALYSADEALNAALALQDHDQLARDFQRQPGLDRSYLLALTRADHTALVNLQWADALLDVVSTYEGLPPRLVAENWTAIGRQALRPLEGKVPAHLQALETMGAEPRANNETTIAIVLNLAEQRAGRATNIMVIFGDARSRGKNVTRDAAHGMNSQLNNTTMDAPRGYGLQGVFTADAIDRAIFTNEFVLRDLADLGAITAAWSSLEHQNYVTQTLGAASPESPPPTTSTPTRPAPASSPALMAIALVAAAGLATAIAGRRRRSR